MKKEPEKPRYGRVRSSQDVGALCRAERQRRRLTLAHVHATTGLSTRFMSEFERGNEHASIGLALRALESLGLDVLVLPRREAERLLRERVATSRT